MKISGEIKIAPDKSISHRALLLSAIASGTSRIKNLLYADDCISTMSCLENLGVRILKKKDEVIVEGRGLNLTKPNKNLDAGNSGTTARLLSGILAGQDFSSTITGDESLSKRPMRRIIEPLERMGAKIIARENNFLPMEIKGNKLKPINYESKIASAQVKSCVLLAGLYADGITRFCEPYKSRDHTERMLKNFGANVETKKNTATIEGVTSLNASDIFVPGDISAAAFFIVATTIFKNSKLKIRDVGINPTRTGIIDIMLKMGAKISFENERLINNEPVADIVIESAELKSTVIKGSEIPRLIDEIPIIAVAATQSVGETIISDAQELRVKETDRLKAISTELKKMGADIEEVEDGLVIKGPTKLKGARVESYGDHRMAMSLTIASLVADGKTTIKNPECVRISFPGFYDTLKKITQ